VTPSRVLEWLVAGVVLAPALAQWLLPDASWVFVGFHSAFGWAWIGILPAALLAIWLRSAPIGASTGVLSLAWSLAVLPGTLGAPHDEADLRIVSANVLSSNPTVDQLAEAIAAEEADLLLIQEVGTAWEAALDALPYPHKLAISRPDNFGIAIYSAQPVRDLEAFDAQGVPWMEATLDIDGVAVRAITVHTLPPVSADYHAVWREQLRQLEALMRAAEGPTVVAGDLNLTRHSPTFRALLATGFHSAHAECGKSWLRTWPATVAVEVFRPDHVLLSPELHCVSLSHLPGAGSDHLGIVVDLALER